jgi:hypothetical protein
LTNLFLVPFAILTRLSITGTSTSTATTVTSVVTDVDTNLFHSLYGLMIELARCFGSGGTYRNGWVKRLQKTVSHLAAATVACAKNEYFHCDMICKLLNVTICRLLLLTAKIIW